MTTDGRPTLGWLGQRWRLILAAAFLASGIAFVLKYINPDTLIQFSVQQEQQSCERRISTFINKGRFCHLNMPEGMRWQCWEIEP